MEIDKIKKVMMGKASREEREEVESWAGGSAERKRFVEDARGFYAGEEIPDGEIEQRCGGFGRRCLCLYGVAG